MIDRIFDIAELRLGTRSAIERAGLRPVLCDLDPHTWTIDPDHLDLTLMLARVAEKVARMEEDLLANRNRAWIPVIQACRLPGRRRPMRASSAGCSSSRVTRSAVARPRRS